jgi:hypothetical protein
MALRLRDPLPRLDGAVRWINGASPSEGDLLDRAVLLHFWSVSCHLCHDVAANAARWYARYSPLGVIFIAVHQPRGPEELDVEKVAADAAGSMRIAHRVAVDNRLEIVRRFDNQFVPAYYLFDREHRLRHFQAGDKGYDRIEAAIERVIAEIPQTAKA